MYDKVDTSLDFCSREKEIIEFWKQNDIFKKSVTQNEGKPEYGFYDGPPTANGKPHIGHILTRVMKDIIPRYRTMKGYHVERKAGWDTHGLPVELEVEKLLGIDGKQEIERYGIEPFIKQCKESVWKYKSEWERMSERVGYWADMENPYVTYDDNYIESVWWAVKQIDAKGMLYKGHKIVPYCPRCGTAISSHEVAQGYKDVEERSVYVRFAIKGEDNAYFLAWTTTPWTLPSNVALCMNADIDYVRIRTDEAQYVLAEALVPALFAEGTYTVVDRRKGKDYEGTEYEPLYPYYKGSEKAFFVTNADYVTTTDGTGIVHIAPAFGEDDSKVGVKYNLPFVKFVDETGRLTADVVDYQGIFVKDADKLIIRDLRSSGKLFKDAMYKHSYPFCWRCDTPLIYYARSGWFIRMSDVRDKLVANNNSVNWMPPTIGSGRMGNFLENAIDWAVSRERYWGTPLPVWVCDKCGQKHVIGSRAELRRLGGLEKDVELHRPYIDAVSWQCECGGTMRRVKEVMDCWFDSGSMPFAQLHYPFENQDKFAKTFPTDFISEAVDQTRGWFYTLEAISTLLFDRAPFKNCIVLGHVCDKDGIKMSKHKGNVIDPWSVLDKQGADAVRWYFYTASSPWLPSRFHPDNVNESQRKFMGTLWNTYAFFVLYADIDGFDPTKHDLKQCKLTQIDRWILSGLNSLVQEVDDDLDNYKITESSRAIQDFVDSLSNWYVRRSRDRFWGKEMTADKEAAYCTLYHVLVTLSKLLAPFTPFMAESIYRNLVCNFDGAAPISVHLTTYPKADTAYIDKALEEDMAFVADAVLLGRACRNKSNIKNRQPLSTIYLSSVYRLQNDGLLDIAADELNVKDVVLLNEDNDLVTYEIKPQLKTLGPKYGKNLGKVRAFLATAGRELVKAVQHGNVFRCEYDGVAIELSEEDLLINTSSKAGYVAESDDRITVVLDTNITPELVQEGIERELISKIQNMRKEAGFEVVDHIHVGIVGDCELLDIATQGRLAKVVLADKVDANASGYAKEFDIGGKNVTISVDKL